MAKKNQPDYNVYIVTETPKGEDNRWHQVGVAWYHKEGNGLNIHTNFPVVTTSLVLRKPKEE